MSNIFAKYKKELSGVKVISSSKAFIKDSKGNFKPNKDYDIIGKINADMPNVILKANKKGSKTYFIEDTSSLTKKTKSDLIDFFFNKKGERNNKRTAYLVRTDKNSKTKPHLRKTNKNRGSQR